MNIQVRAFGIAKKIFGASHQVIEMKAVKTVAGLKNELIEKFPDFKQLASMKIAVNEEYANDDYEIKENDEVVIIPPVAGG